MKLVEQIEHILSERASHTFNKVTVVLNEIVRAALEEELYKNVDSFYISTGQVQIEPTTTQENWIYFTFYNDYNLVDFLTIDMDELVLPKKGEVPSSNDSRFVPFCRHEWIITRGLFKEYKDCKLCKIKWEDLDKK